MVDKFVLFVVIIAPGIVKLEVLRSLWKWKCFYQCFPILFQICFLQNCLTFLNTYCHLFWDLLKNSHFFQYKNKKNTFFGTFVHEVWQSIRSINLSYLLWSLLQSSWKCFSSSGHRGSVFSSSSHRESESVFSSFGHRESECVSINVFQNWSNLTLT